MTAYTKPVTIYQFKPHAHMRGKYFRYDVVYPDGREQTVLTVPQYDCHWQLAHDLETPLKLPAGSKLVVAARYDNSLKNKDLTEMSAKDPARQCGPEKQAYFRNENQSWDEMFTPLIQYSIEGDDPAQPKTAAGRMRSRTSKALQIVKVVGCAARDPFGRWQLTQAADPGVTQTQSTSLAELEAAKVEPFANQQYRLLGAGPFNLETHAGQKLAVKGVLIGDVRVSGINVTSLNFTCWPQVSTATKSTRFSW